VIDLIITIITIMTTSGLLLYLYWRMSRRLDNADAMARRCGDATLTEQRRRHESAFNQLTRDYNDIRDDQQQAADICERLANDIARLTTANDTLRSHIAQLTTENAALRSRIARTTGTINAWGPKTERGQA
jgi:septal ring factor EnvC (AmiA/AmiB activator)